MIRTHEAGALRASLTSRGGDALRQTTDTVIRLGTRVPYAWHHQGRLRRRFIIDLDESELHDMAKIIATYAKHGRSLRFWR